MDRRQFLRGSGAAALGAASLGGGLVSKAGATSLPEAPIFTDPATQPPLHPKEGRPYNPVVTLNGWTLPWRMKDGVKEFHLVAEPVVREMAPGMTANLWGYNGPVAGPTIECVEGDRVRIFVTNKLPEHTAVHWHGLILPNGMDGVGGLNQPQIKPGQDLRLRVHHDRPGTFMYHPHADEMTQMAMGMMGFLGGRIPRIPSSCAWTATSCSCSTPSTSTPAAPRPRSTPCSTSTCGASTAGCFPGIDPLAVRTGDRVRIRTGNLTMTNHPMHLHGTHFQVTCTDGGWVPASARWPEVTTDVAVGQMRAFEFVAVHPGDWAFHCHKSHHTMNAMGHDVPTMIGVDQKEASRVIRELVPDYMAMGSEGMAEMGAMEMPLPDNTLPMMTGQGPFGPVEMGGMFTVVKIHDDVKPGDYRDPGWYSHPPGTVAWEWQGEPPTAERQPGPDADDHTLRAVKPGMHGMHQQ